MLILLYLLKAAVREIHESAAIEIVETVCSAGMWNSTILAYFVYLFNLKFSDST